MLKNYSKGYRSNSSYTALDILRIFKEESDKVFFSNGKRFTREIVRNMSYSELEAYEPFMNKAEIPESDVTILSKIGELTELWADRMCSELYPECECCPFHVKYGDGDMCDLIDGLRTCYNDIV